MDHVKGTPEERLRVLTIELKNYEDKIKAETEANQDEDRLKVLRSARDLVEFMMDEARVEMNLVPESERGERKTREIINDNVRTKFERFQTWAKENLGIVSAIAISIAGIITTVVVAGKGAVVANGQGLGAVRKALARLVKNALPILVPLINMPSTILSWGAKGLAFLAQASS